MNIKNELEDYLNGKHSDSYSDHVYISLNRFENYENFLYMSKKNNEIRTQILEEFEKFDTIEDKILAMRNFFAKNFLYDYHLIFNPAKQTIHRKFEMDGIKYVCAASISPEDHVISDNIYLTRLAQCSTYAAEVKYLMEKMGYECEIVKENKNCYNAFTEKEENVGHCYNVVNVDGKKIEIDICKDIMDRDKQILEDSHKNIR